MKETGDDLNKKGLSKGWNRSMLSGSGLLDVVAFESRLALGLL